MLIVGFVHYLGIAMWIGGWMAAVVMAYGARREDQRVRVTVAGLVARMQIALVGPGALLTVGSGILWTMAIVGGGTVQSRVAPVGAWIMTAAGIVGGTVVAVLVIPTALKVKSVAVCSEDGSVLPVFERQEQRLRIVSTIAGLCALLSLLAAVPVA